jgi:polyferredoxin
MLVFLLLPWVKIGGAQAILLDIPARRFTIFGVQFWAHDGPLLFLIFASFAVALILVTSIWGRVWCGYACPQTVFVEGLFRTLERWIEGPAPARKLLDKAPWTADKVAKRSLKYVAFFVATLVVTHSFLAYFVGKDQVLDMVFRPPAENMTSFIFVVALTAVLYFNFAWFREQFCIILCPYGRLQSALFDSSTMIVGYKEARGDCIQCKKCVNVCPTGIDIRDGVQLECIACTACMDACDSIMEKINKPKGLIAYTSEQELAGVPVKKLRPRTLAYGLVLLGVLSAFSVILSLRKEINVEVIKTELQTKSSPTDLSIFQYTLEIANQTAVPKKLRLEAQANDLELIAAVNPVTIPPGRIQRVDFFLRLQDNRLSLPEGRLRLHVEGEHRTLEVSLTP